MLWIKQWKLIFNGASLSIFSLYLQFLFPTQLTCSRCHLCAVCLHVYACVQVSSGLHVYMCVCVQVSSSLHVYTCVFRCPLAAGDRVSSMDGFSRYGHVVYISGRPVTSAQVVSIPPCTTCTPFIPCIPCTPCTQCTECTPWTLCTPCTQCALWTLWTPNALCTPCTPYTPCTPCTPCIHCGWCSLLLPVWTHRMISSYVCWQLSKLAYCLEISEFSIFKTNNLKHLLFNFMCGYTFEWHFQITNSIILSDIQSLSF